MNATGKRPSSPYTRAMDRLRFSDAQKDALKRALLNELRQAGDAVGHVGGAPTPIPREETAIPTALQYAIPSEPHADHARTFPSAASPVAAASAAATPASCAARASGACRTDGRRITRRAAATLLAAAAVGVCTAGAALATGVVKFDLSDIAARLFGATPSQSAAVNRVGQTVGASASNAGMTVSLDAVVGDRHNIVCAFRATNDDGSPFAVAGSPDGARGGYFFGSSTLFAEGPDGSAVLGAVGGTSTCTVSDDGSYIQVLSFLNAEDPLVGCAATAHFENLMAPTCDAGTGSAGFETVAAGTWDLAFTIDYEDSSVALDGGQPVSYGGIDATIVAVELSPIGLFIMFELDDPSRAVGPDNPYDPDAAAFALMPVSLTLADGTVVAFEQGSNALEDLGGSGYQDPDGSYNANVTRNIVFDRIYDLADIASVTVGGVEIPVEQAG